MYTLLGATIKRITDTQGVVEIEVFELESERVGTAIITVGIDGETRPLDGIECASFGGREFEGFVRSVYVSIVMRLETARTGRSRAST